MSASPSFDWASFLTVSRDLVAPPPTPARLRSGISRAYYAAYNKALGFLKTQGGAVPPKLGRHQNLWKQYKRNPDAKRKSVGNLGGALLTDRLSADYDDQFAGDLAKQAGLAVQKAELVLGYLENLAATPGQPEP